MSTGDLAFGDENPLAKKIREFMGVGDFEKVRVVTSQCERTDGRKIYYFPKTKAEFDILKTAPDDILFDIGLGLWEEGHWLYPGEWFNNIPEGYEIVNISRKVKSFSKEEESEDIRYGCLAFGFIKEPVIV